MNTLMPLILLHVAFFSILSIQCSAENDGNLIERTCQQTPYVQVCYTCLASAPQTFKADAKGLALIAVHKLNDSATSVIAYIKQLYRGTRDLSVKTALQGCDEGYNTVVNVLLPEALEALTNGNIKFANDGISNTGREAVKCQNYFNNLRSKPLSGSNKYVYELSEVVLSIVKPLL